MCARGKPIHHCLHLWVSLVICHGSANMRNILIYEEMNMINDFLQNRIKYIITLVPNMSPVLVCTDYCEMRLRYIGKHIAALDWRLQA